MTFFDTNFLILALSSGTVEESMFRSLLRAGESLKISAIVWTEFRCGPVTPNELNVATTAFPLPEPFIAQDGTIAAELFNGTGRRRTSLADCMIAAMCLRRNATLATNNVADFQRFAPWGLKLLTP